MRWYRSFIIALKTTIIGGNEVIYSTIFEDIEPIIVDNTYKILPRIIDQDNIRLTMFDDEDYGEQDCTVL